MATPRTSAPKKSSKVNSHRQQGFSLLELMIVLGIVGAVIAVGIPRFRNQENNLKTSARQMAALFREVRNEARLKRMTYRIVYQLGSENAYWIESASGRVLIPSQTRLEDLQKMDEKERPASPFQKATKLIKEKKEMPGNLKIASVETGGSPDPVTEGTAYIYFSPEGLSEKAIVQITNGKDVTWSLILNPLTGHAEIVENPVRLKDL